jgi:hypothetical protein
MELCHSTDFKLYLKNDAFSNCHFVRIVEFGSEVHPCDEDDLLPIKRKVNDEVLFMKIENGEE